MPEGDTIHKIAAAIRPRLEGETVQRAWLNARDAHELEAHRVDAVYALGKHLFIEIGSSQVLRSHLGMHGDWHRYRPGESWNRPERQASLAIWTALDVFVCFNAKEVQVLSARSIAESNIKRRLGPDLLGDSVDFSAIVQRAREFLEADSPLVDLLLDQRVAGGVGNVYKSEVLFIEGESPFSRISDISDDRVVRLYRCARDLLRRNLGGGRRVTRFVSDAAGSLWVYRRTDQPCLRCSSRIRFVRGGRNRRSVYWCDQCQRTGE